MATQRSDSRQRQTQHQQGGQHAASVGDSTLHHVDPWDFSVALANAGGLHRSPQGDSTRDDPALALFWFEQERAMYAGLADRCW